MLYVTIDKCVAKPQSRQITRLYKQTSYVRCTGKSKIWILRRIMLKLVTSLSSGLKGNRIGFNDRNSC
jgi:hypothetical protein